MRDGIIKRGASYYYVVRERDPLTGKTKPRWRVGGKTRKAAMQARDEARSALHQGTYVAPATLTVTEWLTRWLDGHSVELKPSTIHGYRATLDRYVKPAIGHERLQSLSPSRLSVVFRQIRESGGKDGKPVSVRTVEYARAVLRKAMSDAVTERLLTVNPVTGSKMPKRDGKAKHTTWDGGQIRTFLDHTSETRLHPVWQLAAATGMRRGEMMALTWADVDLDAATVSVERSTTQVAQDRVTTDTKNHESRVVNIDAHAVAVLRSWRTQQTAERLQWGPAYATGGHLFTWENGAPYLPDYITKAFIKAQAGAGLPRIVLHEVRHSHATALLRAGVPVHIVAKRLGHKDPSVTLNVYADVIPADDDKAADVFSVAVWGA